MATAQLAYRVAQVPGLQLTAGIKHTGNTPLRPSGELSTPAFTLLNLGATYLYDKRLIDFGIPALGNRPVDVDRDKRFGSGDADQDYARSEVFSLTASLDYRINDDFTLTNTSRYYRYDLDRNNTLADEIERLR